MIGDGSDVNRVGSPAPPALAVSLFFLAETLGQFLVRDAMGRRVTIMLDSLAVQFGVTLRETGLAVAAAWMALLLTGRWRAEPSWIDRAGQIWACSGSAISSAFDSGACSDDRTVRRRKSGFSTRRKP